MILYLKYNVMGFMSQIVKGIKKYAPSFNKNLKNSCKSSAFPSIKKGRAIKPAHLLPLLDFKGKLLYGSFISFEAEREYFHEKEGSKSCT